MNFVIFYKNSLKQSELCIGCSFWVEILSSLIWTLKSKKTFKKLYKPLKALKT